MSNQTNVAVQPKIQEGGVHDVITPHVSFPGTCKQALEFYQEVLGGEITMMTWDQMPEGGCPDQGKPESSGCGPSPEAMAAARKQKLVMHGRLYRAGNPVLMASDVPPGAPFQTGNNFWLSLSFATPADIDRVFAGMSNQGQVMMPPSETFFAQKFAMLTDRFGINWMLIQGEKSHQG